MWEVKPCPFSVQSDNRSQVGQAGFGARSTGMADGERGVISRHLAPGRMSERFGSRFGLREIFHLCGGSTQLQVRESADHIALHDPSMLQNLFEFDRTCSGAL